MSCSFSGIEQGGATRRQQRLHAGRRPIPPAAPEEGEEWIAAARAAERERRAAQQREERQRAEARQKAERERYAARRAGEMQRRQSRKRQQQTAPAGQAAAPNAKSPGAGEKVVADYRARIEAQLAQI